MESLINGRNPGVFSFCF